MHILSHLRKRSIHFKHVYDLRLNKISNTFLPRLQKYHKIFTMNMMVKSLVQNKMMIPFPYNKPTRCTNFSNLFWKETLTCFGQCLCPSSGVFHCSHSSGICHIYLLTACKRGSGWNILIPACKQSANMYDIYHCCVYSEKLLIMDRGNVRNM